MSIAGKTVRGRVYRRKIDYDEARQLHAQGFSLAVIAARFGVTSPAIRLVVDEDANSASVNRARKFARSHRCDCGAPAFKRYGRVRCRDCANRDAAVTVRDEELRCTTCGKWKPDAEFPHNRANRQRRERHGQCRACGTAEKARWRARRRAAGMSAP